MYKLDGVGPVDNRPSTDKVYHFSKKNKKNKTCDTWHVTCDTWHVTHDMWYVTHDTFGGVNILSKFQLPSSYCLWFTILWRSGGKGWLTQLMNQLMTALFIEQPRLLTYYYPPDQRKTPEKQKRSGQKILKVKTQAKLFQRPRQSPFRAKHPENKRLLVTNSWR